LPDKPDGREIMHFRGFFILILALTLWVSSPGPAPASIGIGADPTIRDPGAERGEPVTIRILLSRIQGVALVSSPQGIRIDSMEGKPLYRTSANDGVALQGEGENLRIMRPDAPPGLPSTVSVTPVHPDSFVSLNGKRYRGAIRVSWQNQQLYLINVLDVEKYLLGVVPMEFQTSYPEMARAQAVVARTFALAHLGRFEKQGYDFTADTNFQVYGGYGVEDPMSTAGVMDTEGMVMSYKGKLARYALYHSTCGGATARNESVYMTGAIPYLRSVPCRVLPGEEESPGAPLAEDWPVVKSDSFPPDFLEKEEPSLCGSSSYYRWTATWTEEQMAQDLGKYSGNPGIKEIRDVEITSRGPSGRIVEMTVRTNAGDVQLRGNGIRSALMLRKPGGSASPLYSTRFVISKGQEGGQSVWTAKGGGWGHGLGMCQYGALGLAKRGWDFRRILKKYFYQVEIVPYQSLQTVKPAAPRP
jgi:stage II sporulation protein D